MEWTKKQIAKSAEEACEYSGYFTGESEKKILENLATSLDAVGRIIVSREWDAFPTLKQ